MQSQSNNIAPGARVVVRDAEWLVRKVERTSTGGHALSVIGISELVKDKESIFLDEIDNDIEVLDPVDTRLVADSSSAYQKSILYMESLLRQTPPTDENLYIGHKAAMDPVLYQLDPSIQALKQPRQRILIADAVGLGKTLACGIMLSELIRRGRGKRILVLAVKSMLTQFQKEMWSRFTIPLVRLDSIGIQRVRTNIPTNHNPFYYFDKAIISIDTLKQDTEYRTYLENAFWDIIVIDEAHNVAERGKGSSQRARLAKLLSGRSDTLIMLSATPHDGKARSFASLMNMLDPTAIADPDNYGPDDIKGLFIRRFKCDIQDQVKNAFMEREISKAYCIATDAEEHAFNILSEITFERLDQHKSSGQLFKTTLEKSLFSSPSACLQTIDNRISRLSGDDSKAAENDIYKLKKLHGAVAEITADKFSKYQKLLSIVKEDKSGFGWTGKSAQERLVIFTERIETLKFLKENIIKDLKLRENQVETLYGSMSDIEQQRVVEEFGKEESSVRLLIASDVASEGINLHYLSHHLIHFDIPWSLMVFQQRNGRIDRYGQDKTPYILYLVNQCDNPEIKGDLRILELLIRKDEEAVKNIGDPGAFMGVYDIDEEEKITAKAIEGKKSDSEFEKLLDSTALNAFNPLNILLKEATPSPVPEVSGTNEKLKTMPSLFANDYQYVKTAIEYLKQKESIQVEFIDSDKQIILTATEDLKHRLNRILPGEVWSDDDTFTLTPDTDEIQKEIKRSRKDEKAWPAQHFLWPLNPIVEWLNDKIIAEFRRHEAPVLYIPGVLSPGETVFIISGLVPNLKGHPLVHLWHGVSFSENKFTGIEPFEAVLSRTGLGRKAFPNQESPIDMDSIRNLLPEAISQARKHMSTERDRFEKNINDKLQEQLDALERLKERHYHQLELYFRDKKQLSRREQQKREIDRIFDDFISWIEDTMTTENNPFIQLIAVLRGGAS